MKKVIAKEKGVCPICSKKGIVISYDNGEKFCEHKRTKSDVQIMGQFVTNVEGCYITNK